MILIKVEQISEYITKNINKNLKNYNNKLLLIVLLKSIMFIIVIFNIKYFNILTKDYKINLNKKYLNIKHDLNLTNADNLSKKINLAFYAYGLKNGGRSRITSILINHFYKLEVFNIFLFTRRTKEENEYTIPENIKRTLVQNDIIEIIKKNRINIIVYHLYYENEIKKLNNLKKVNVIYYLHTCFIYWVYANYNSFKTVYRAYIGSKYIISLIPFENDYLFTKWGINSILMYNFIPYEFEKTILSDLSSQTILMIGRGDNIYKRFELGILAMEYISKEIPICEMKIISNVTGTYNLEDLVNNINLKENVKFVGYSSTPEIYFKNASLHIFPTISESFGLALAETKLFGIPNILVGLDYVSIAKGGTKIVYDDSPESISIEAIKILNNKIYMKKLGKEGRKSMIYFNNQILFKKWNKLIFSIYNGDNYYKKIKEKENKISENESINILNNQIRLLKLRDKRFYNITLFDIENFTIMENFL